jgi:hypothetical protein
MAALMPFLEAPPLEAEAASAGTAIAEASTPSETEQYAKDYAEAVKENKRISKKRGVDVNRMLLPILAKPHSELTNLMWTRAAIVRHLAGVNITVERKPIVSGVPKEKLGFGTPSEFFLRLSQPLPGDVVPWWGIAGGGERAGATLFSTNSKMACPTFDLPAGSGPMGGTCPGAIAGQSVVPPETRLKAAQDVIDATGHYKLETAVCEYCYATGSKYGETSTQMKELIAFAFVRRMVMQNPELLVQILYEGVLGAEGFFAPGDPTQDFGFLPVRVHSSGDFFDQRYAQVWIEVAWKLLENERAGGRAVKLWAPTRTQVNPGWAKFWAAAQVPHNFIIRPSGYHVDDTAPRPIMNHHDFDASGRRVAIGPGSEGTSVIHKDIAPQYAGERYDFQCQTYGLDKGNRTCAISHPPSAASPKADGVAPSESCGCRACWLFPKLRVNYAFH